MCLASDAVCSLYALNTSSFCASRLCITFTYLLKLEMGASHWVWLALALQCEETFCQALRALSIPCEYGFLHWQRSRF